MYYKNDFKELQEILTARPESYINQLFIGIDYVKKGCRIYFDDPVFDSFDYNCQNNQCKDFRTNKSYDMISLYAHFFTGNNQWQALRQIKQKLRLSPSISSEGSHGSNSNSWTSIGSAAKSVFDNVKKQRAIDKIWNNSKPAIGSLVEAYLSHRGYVSDIPINIRFHDQLYHRISKSLHPAMICGITIWPDDEIKAILRTYLKDDGCDKAKISPNKMMLGNVKGGAVRFAPPSKSLVIAEGVETALSVSMSTGIPTWAALSASGMIGVVVPPLDITSEIIIAADNDEAGTRAAGKLANRLINNGYTVRIAIPPHEQSDFNDLLMENSNE